MKIFCGKNSKNLAKRTARLLKTRLGKKEFKRFPDNEIWIRYKERIFKEKIFIVQSTQAPAENIIELLLMINAAKMEKAKRISVIIPYFGYARQDRILKKGEPLSAKVLANVIKKVGANEVCVFDIHSPRVTKFFKIPVFRLSALSLFKKEIKKIFKEKISEILIIAPDFGAIHLAKKLSQNLGNIKYSFLDKKRKGGRIKISNLKIDVKGRNVILIDDIISTGNTLCKSANFIKKKGADKIYAFCTHALLAPSTIKKIESSPINKLFITDSIPQKNKSKKIKVLSLAPIIADFIRNRIDF